MKLLVDSPPTALPVRRLETTTELPTEGGYDLLRVAPIRAVLLSPFFPYVLQTGMLVVFVALAILGWGLVAPDGVPTKLFAKCNLVTLMIWGLWWPAMVWGAVLLGRAWCMICPLELASNVGERLGRRLGVHQRPLARWLAVGWVIVILYATIQLLVAGAGMHRSPHRTAMFLCALLTLAFVTGLFLMHRAFCRGFCPVGLLLGTYGRGGMLAVRAGGADKCADCDERHCLRACDRAKFDGRSCPSLLNPPKLNSNRDCLVCGQCIKVCRPDNMRFLLRLPFSKYDTREVRASWPVTLFVMLVSGFVLGELCTEWAAAQKWFVAAPEWVAHHISLSGAEGWLEGVWALLIVPVVLWTILAGIGRFAGRRGGILDIWRRMALPVAVIVAAGHMSKGLAKFTTWAGFLPQAVTAPDGIATASAIGSKSLASPAPLLPMWAVALVGCSLVGLGFAFAAREARFANDDRHKAALAPMALVALLFVGIIMGWA